MPSGLHIPAWRERLTSYHDKQLCDFLEFGWPIGYTKSSPPQSSSKNHGSALARPDIIDAFLVKECSLGATCGPFSANPLATPLITSPLQIATSRSGKPRVVLDLSFPAGSSVNSGIPKDTYLNEPFSLRLPGTDALQALIRIKGSGCHLFKKDLSRAYRQLRVDPHDYSYLEIHPQWSPVLRHRPSIRSPLSHDDVPAHHFRGHFHVQFPRFCLYELHRRLQGHCSSCQFHSSIHCP